ncbi:MAG: virulence RhuM family protein [Ignavibacteriales bacterium]|nr:virulence RhuM family protein [Ignavibacteriales bacterium]MCF8316180.1 virulence RhuM family protein [Ignavibacteriales bacterium]MCF8436682.1 virulence RhuM family protein [Ignavibacteriales bacterium]
MENKIEIYRTADDQTEVIVQFDENTVWLSQKQMAELFVKDTDTIGLHLKNIYSESELNELSTTEFFSVVQKEGKRSVQRRIKFYNLDAIISVGYRVNSKRGTQFRQWATRRLKDYLVQGYAINEKRMQQKQQEVEYLKTGIRILNRAMAEQTTAEEFEMLRVFAKGLALLDDYDHETLDKKGITQQETIYPTIEEYEKIIHAMRSEFNSDVFAKPKDNSFQSSINQIRQGFGETEFYTTLEEKAANLLYFITKNHSFADGNKRIAASCFLYFLKQNNALLKANGLPILDNAALAALTLFIATSKTEEAEIVKQFVISILNRNK